MHMVMDSLDNALIKLLMKDARQSSNELAKKLGVNSSTIRRRIERLLKEHIIHITARPDSARLGLPVTAFLALTVSHDRISSVLKALAKFPQIRWIAATTGRFDVMALVWIESTDELYKFIEREIDAIDGVLHTEPFVNLRVEKRRSGALKVSKDLA